MTLCLTKYADFSGRAPRSEYWWFSLGVFGIAFGAALLSDVLYVLAVMGLLLPSLAAGARRLHDTGNSGWMLLFWLIPIIGTIVLIVLMVQEGEQAPNRYGPPTIR
jgi:uncharacterized membrane protein YhaH (DUF805 family)